MSDPQESFPGDVPCSVQNSARITTETRAWKSRPFRWLWAGSTASALGTEIGELAIPLLALLSLSASPAELSALRVAQFAPFLLAALPIGLLIDRVRRRPLMIGADLGRAFAVALIPLAVWLGVGEVPLLAALLFVVGTLTVLYQTADFALLPGLVTPGQLTDANAKLSASYSAAEIGGRGIGGLLVQYLTAPFAMLVNAIGFLLSAFSLSRLRVSEPAPRPATDRGLDALLSGMRIAWRNRVLRGFLAGATTFNLFYEVFMICVMLYLVNRLGVSALVVGAVMVLGGVGSLIGSWFGPKISRRRHYGKVLLWTLAVGNTAPLLVGFAFFLPGHEVWVVMTAFVLMGMGIGISNAHVVTVRQIASPPESLGRVNAAYRFVSWGAVPIGALIGGVAASHLGSFGGMMVGAIGLASATLWVAGSPVRRLQTVQDAKRHA